MGGLSPSGNDRRWLRLGAAAELLGVSENTLRRWSDAGKLVCYRSAGGHRRYRRADVDALLRDGSAGGARRRAPRAATPESYAATIAALEARNRDLQMLVEAGEDVSRLSSRDVLESVARRLSRLTHAPVTDIYAVEGELLRALVSYDHGAFDPTWEGTTCTLREYPCSAVAVSKRRISCAASLDDPVLTPVGRRSLEKWGYQSQLSAPLVVRNEVIGILELSDHMPRDYAEHLALVEGLSHVAARAIETPACSRRSGAATTYSTSSSSSAPPSPVPKTSPSSCATPPSAWSTPSAPPTATSSPSRATACWPASATTAAATTRASSAARLRVGEHPSVKASLESRRSAS